ncbi:MAG: uncharacterized membrane protein YheB (UPF0754 family) [Planctomycetota bacterium]|jgi:uncharacterized membrane protein YheB (UPF0754 family)
MTPSLTIWIVVPLLGGLIGYATNRIAVMMIFRPYEPRRVLGIRFHGLIPRRQADMAKSIGGVVGGHLLGHDDIMGALGEVDLTQLAEKVIDRGLGPKIDELRKLPLVGGFLTDERVHDLKAQMASAISDNKELLISEFERAMESGIDVQEIVSRKVAAFPVQRLEELILEVASRELRSIEVLGGVLGVLIGFGQVAVLALLG